MFKLKKIYTLLIAAVLMCAAMAFVACGKVDGPYKVTVKDAAGNPCGSGVVVVFMQDGVQVGMQVCDQNGVATKELEAGDYTVQLQFTSADANYYYEEAKVTAKNREVEITLMNCVSEEHSTTIAQGEEAYVAYEIGEGTTYASFDTEHRNYYIFTPNRAGMYEIYVEDAAGVTIGYYGAPHFVQSNSVVEPVNGVIKVSVSEGMIGAGDAGTTRLVIGIDVNDGQTANGKIVVKRTGEPEWNVADEEWTIYKATVDLSKYTLTEGATLTNFDLTANNYTLVLNENDGFYHLNTADGPLVLVYLTEDTKYLSCFKNILDRSGVSKYFFDENEKFIKKESYSECLLEYIECADEKTGVYPLTEDLKYIIQQRGDYVGWFDVESSNYIFIDGAGNKDKTINADIAWLFMCCYIAN